jgi:hypothetical protein
VTWMRDDGGGDDDECDDAFPAPVCPRPCRCRTMSGSRVAFCGSVCEKASLAGIGFCCD